MHAPFVTIVYSDEFDELDPEICAITGHVVDWKEVTWDKYMKTCPAGCTVATINDMVRFVVVKDFAHSLDAVNCGVYLDLGKQWVFHPIFITNTSTEEQRMADMRNGLECFSIFVSMRLKLVSASGGKRQELLEMCRMLKSGWVFQY